MNTLRLILLCLSTSICVNASATTASTMSDYIATHWLASASVGQAWGNTGRTQTLVLAPEIEKTYQANSSSSSMFNGELFLGVHQSVNSFLQGQVGLALAVAGHAVLSGDVWDDASSQFDNYTYQYLLRHQHAALKGKLLLDNGYPILPWISASVGVGCNTAYGFNNTPKIAEAVPMSNFSSQATTSFTYTLGVGVQYPINQHWQIGIGYEFADWGQSQLSRAPQQATSDVLSLSHYYTNSVLANLVYIA